MVPPLMFPMWVGGFLALTLPAFATPASVPRAEDAPSSTYDYIVIGSGPGGGITASNLALAGHSVLLLEAGPDGSDDVSTFVVPLSSPGNPELSWHFYVKHYADEEQELRNNQLTWQRENGSYWVGNGKDAPDDASLLGVYYPRGATVGGSAITNAMGTFLPNDADWDFVKEITGDDSWGHEHIRELFMKAEKNHYLEPGTAGHGFDGYMDTWVRSSSFYRDRSPGKLQWLKTEAEAFGQDPDKILEILDSDCNYLSETRDADNGITGLPMHQTPGARRWSPRDLIKAVAKEHDLTLRPNSLASKIIFDTDMGENSKRKKKKGKKEEKRNKTPRAVGVEYLEGKLLYGASSGWNPEVAQDGILKRAYARKEVIVSGGAFNSPQILQLSGIGDRKHLESLGIDVVAHLPGVGRHLQDNQELPIAGHGLEDATFGDIPDAKAAELGCTRGAEGDPCLELWYDGEGPYTAPTGNSEIWTLTTNHTPDGHRDMLTFMGGGVFRGFFRRDPSQQLPIDPPNTVARSMVRMSTQNDAGMVMIKSSNPLEPPEINFEHFGTHAETDIGAMIDAIAWTRRAFAKVPAPYGPVRGVEPPCPSGVQEDGYCSAMEEDVQWIRDQTFGHHPTGTCKIGADDDEFAVLDSKFRVRGVEGLRVVDASAFPRNPGAFPVLPTVLMGEKAAEVILQDLEVEE